MQLHGRPARNLEGDDLTGNGQAVLAPDRDGP
jgi:hypothetical protein